MAFRILPGSHVKEPRPHPASLGPKKPKPKPNWANSVTLAQSQGGVSPDVRPATHNNASQGGNGGGHPGGAGGRGGSPVALANAQIRSGINDARKDRRVVRREAATARRAAIGDYHRSLGDLNYIFGETGDYINQMGQQIQGGYDSTRASIAAATSSLVQQLQGNSQGVASGLADEFARTGGIPLTETQLGQDANNAVNMANVAGTNNLANLDFQAQGANAITSLLGGMNAGDKASQYGVAQNTLNANLYDIYQGKREGYNKVAEAISDLRGTRKDLTTQMLQQMGDGHWGKFLRGGKKKKSYSSGGGSSYTPYTSSSSSSGGSSSSSSHSSSGPTKPGKNFDINSLLTNGIIRPRRR